MIDPFGRCQSVVVLGGSSDIARAIVKEISSGRCRSVVLAGRSEATLALAAADLGSSVPHVVTVSFDAADDEDPADVVERCFDSAREPVDLVILAVGELGTQGADERVPARVSRLLTVNLTWPAAALSAVATRLQQQGHGRIVVLSSVAGARIRRSNYLYGASKAGLDAYAQGLGESLRGSGVALHIVRPGFVRTKMTIGLPAAPFACNPDRVATDTVRGIRREQAVIWSPTVLRWAFAVMRLLPQSAWRRLPG